MYIGRRGNYHAILNRLPGSILFGGSEMIPNECVVTFVMFVSDDASMNSPLNKYLIPEYAHFLDTIVYTSPCRAHGGNHLSRLRYMGCVSFHLN